jgi:hypothetical protein
LVLSGPSEQDTDGKEERSAYDDLNNAFRYRRFHVTILDKYDRPEFDKDHGDGDSGRQPEMRIRWGSV